MNQLIDNFQTKEKGSNKEGARSHKSSPTAKPDEIDNQLTSLNLKLLKGNIKHLQKQQQISDRNKEHIQHIEESRLRLAQQDLSKRS